MSALVRISGPAALLVALIALVFAMSGVSDAQRKRGGKVVRTDKRDKIPSKFLPKAPTAVEADRVGELTPEDLATNCTTPDQIDLGTWCLMNAPYATTPEEAGKTTYFFATQKCVELGGYLPTAGQLTGAAARVKLAGSIDDSQLTASTDIDATDGLKDRREMSATLVTTAAGATAAGSQGVTDGSTGDPKQGEPNPAPRPSSPAPETLQYVTVYDNKDQGGFAGSRPVAQPEQFRCAFNKGLGQPTEPGATEGGGGGSTDSGSTGSGSTGSGSTGSGSTGSGSSGSGGGGSGNNSGDRGSGSTIG